VLLYGFSRFASLGRIGAGDTHGHTHCVAFAFTHICADENLLPHPRTFAHTFDADQHSYTYTHAHTDQHALTYGYTYVHEYTDRDSHTAANPYTDSRASDEHTAANSYTDPHADTHAHAGSADGNPNPIDAHRYTITMRKSCPLTFRNSFLNYCVSPAFPAPKHRYAIF